MPTLKSIRGFTGLNTQSPNTLIDDRELQVCENYMVGLQGELQKRPGLAKLNSAAFTAPISLLGAFTNPATTEMRLFANQASSTTNKYSEDGTTWTALGTAKANISWAATLGAKLFFGNDSDGVHEYSFSTNLLTALANSPSGNEGIVFKQRMFVVAKGATPSYSGRIQFSEPYGATSGGSFTDAAAWPATNTIDVESESEGDFIVTLYPINDVLYIFKRNSIWTLYVQGLSPADWILRKVVSNLGCIYKRGVMQFNDLVYFRSQNGMYRTNGVTFQEISGQIRDQVRLPAGTMGGMPVNTGSQGPIRYKEYILFPTSSPSTSTKTIWCYNYKTNAWSKWEPNLPADAFYSWVGVERGTASLIPGAYFSFGGGLTSNRFIMAIQEGSEVTTDDGAPFMSSMRTKEFDFDRLDLFKRINWIGSDSNSQRVDLTYTADDVANTNTVSVDIAVPRRFVKAPGPGACRRISVKITDDGEVYPGRINGIIIEGTIDSEVSKASTK